MVFNVPGDVLLATEIAVIIPHYQPNPAATARWTCLDLQHGDLSSSLSVRVEGCGSTRLLFTCPLFSSSRAAQRPQRRHAREGLSKFSRNPNPSNILRDH